MNTNFHFKNLTVSPEEKDKILSKLSRIDRLLASYPSDLSHADLSLEKESEKPEYHAHLTVTFEGRAFHSEKTGFTIFEPTEHVVETVREQILKFLKKD